MGGGHLLDLLRVGFCLQFCLISWSGKDTTLRDRDGNRGDGSGFQGRCRRQMQMHGIGASDVHYSDGRQVSKAEDHSTVTTCRYGESQKVYLPL